MAIRYQKKSIAALEAEAKGGDVGAMYSLGLLHELGLVSESNEKVALKWYAEGAKLGDGPSALSAGLLSEKTAAEAHIETNVARKFYEVAEKRGFRQSSVRLAEAGIIHQRRILLVDSVKTSREQLRDLLNKKGFEVIEAPDAEHALRVVQKDTEIHLVLSLVELAGMSGLEMLAVIRNGLAKKQLPVVMITSLRQIENIKKAMQLGVQGWMLRPFEFDSLESVLRRSLSKRSKV